MGRILIEIQRELVKGQTVEETRHWGYKRLSQKK